MSMPLFKKLLMSSGAAGGGGVDDEFGVSPVQVVRRTVVISSGQAIGFQENLTIPGFGTPKAVVFMFTASSGLAGTYADTADGADLCIGVIDAAGNEFAIAIASEDARSSANTGHHISSERCLIRPNPNGAASSGEARFHSFVTDGVRIQHERSFSAAVRVDMIFIGGDNVLNTLALSADVGGVTDGATAIPVGFEPGLVFAMSAQKLNTTGFSPIVNATHSPFQFGVCANDPGFSGVTQACMVHRGADNADPTTNVTLLSTSYTVAQSSSSGGAISLAQELGNFSSSGFDVISRLAAVTRGIGLFCIELAPEIRRTCIATQVPTTGAHTYTENGFGFPPDFALSCFAPVGAYDTGDVSNAGSFGFTSFCVDGYKGYGSASSTYADTEGANTSNTKSTHAKKFLVHNNNTGVLLDGDQAELTVGGYEVGLTTAGLAALGWAVAFGGGAVGRTLEEYLSSNPIRRAAWNFNGAGSTIADIIGSADLTTVNGPTASVSAAPFTGVGTGYSFNGTDQYAEAINDTILDGADNGSIFGVFSLDALPAGAAYATVFCYGANTATYNMRFRVKSDGKLSVLFVRNNVSTAVWEWESNSSVITAGVINTVSIVQPDENNGPGLRVKVNNVYVPGTYITQTTNLDFWFSDLVAGNPDRLTFGASRVDGASAFDYLDGTIYHFEILDSQLTYTHSRRLHYAAKNNSIFVET